MATLATSDLDRLVSVMDNAPPELQQSLSQVPFTILITMSERADRRFNFHSMPFKLLTIFVMNDISVTRRKIEER
jgi:hypothetical protein